MDGTAGDEGEGEEGRDEERTTMVVSRDHDLGGVKLYEKATVHVKGKWKTTVDVRAVVDRQGDVRVCRPDHVRVADRSRMSSCPHLGDLVRLREPLLSQSVHREECTQCFDNHASRLTPIGPDLFSHWPSRMTQRGSRFASAVSTVAVSATRDTTHALTFTELATTSV
jgi:hypothetical protein